MITLATMMMFAHVLQDPRPGIIIDGPALGNKHPHGVMVFLKKHKLTGDLFTPLWWGSYFTWELYPYIKVSMDGRNVTLFDPKDVTDNLVFYHEADADLGIPLRSYARYVVVPADAADGKLLPRLRRIHTGCWPTKMIRPACSCAAAKQSKPSWTSGGNSH